MIDSVFGDLNFSTGWKAEIQMKLFEKAHRIIIKARAYYEADGLTSAQESAFSDYTDNIDERRKEVEALLRSYAGENCAVRFFPRTLLFERNGEYALLCDDRDDPDGGIAVILAPEQKVMSQDDYL